MTPGTSARGPRDGGAKTESNSPTTVTTARCRRRFDGTGPTSEEGKGSFTTQAVTFQGSRLRLNVRTRHVGGLRVEVLDRESQPIEGRTFEDCDYISGDYFDRAVTWRGDPDLGRRPGEPVSFAVELSHGQLFSMRFE